MIFILAGKHIQKVFCLIHLIKQTPLHIASKKGNIEIVEYLLSHNVNTNAKDLNLCIFIKDTLHFTIVRNMGRMKSLSFL